MTPTTRLLAAFAASVVLAACGSAEATDDGTASPTPTMTTETVGVTGVDYGFEGVPQSVPTGTELAFRNGSDVEFHEMAVFRVAEDEDRTAEELFALAEEEGMAALEFVGVAAGRPGTSGELLEGSLTLTDPGRYVLACFVPVGADAEVVAEAFAGATDGPPELPEGQPHVAAGMLAEVTVE